MTRTKNRKSSIAAPMTPASTSSSALLPSSHIENNTNVIDTERISHQSKRRRTNNNTCRQLESIHPDPLKLLDRLNNTPVPPYCNPELIKSISDSPTRVVTPDYISSTQQIKVEKYGETLVTPEYDEHSLTKRKLVYDDMDGFIDLHIAPKELRPSASLTTGQCFNWRAIAHDNGMDKSNPITSAWGTSNASSWIGVLRVAKSYLYAKSAITGHSRLTGDNDATTCSIVVMIRESAASTWYKTFYAPPYLNVSQVLYCYFHITQGCNNSQGEQNISLSNLYDEWSSQCSRLKQIAACIPGVRILNQDPWECFVSFLCSSNNNIPRITKMLQSIRENYGDEIVIDDKYMKTDKVSTDVKYYSFPSLKTLLEYANENDLRHKCGMGYRAKYLMQSMKLLDSLGGEEYLHQLKYDENDPIKVQESLLQFLGVGRKVADCIALFSLNQHDSIPVDVHVWNIARRDYDDKKRTLNHAKSLTPTIYKHVGDQFRSRFPNKSGWVHSLLFVAELPSFRSVLPENILKDMDKFKKKEKNKK